MTVRIMILTSLMLAIMGCQTLAQKSAMEILQAEQVVQLFQEQTVESFNLNNGTTSFTYYGKDGKVIQERYWQKRQGQWQVNASGEICLAMEAKPFSCRPVVNNNGKYYKYRRDENNQLQKIIRYRQFIAGNAL
ncbi:MAG: hypothetical protein V7739_11340 [Motiliproteus sp.]